MNRKKFRQSGIQFAKVLAGSENTWVVFF